MGLDPPSFDAGEAYVRCTDSGCISQAEGATARFVIFCRPPGARESETAPGECSCAEARGQPGNWHIRCVVIRAVLTGVLRKSEFLSALRIGNNSPDG